MELLTLLGLTTITALLCVLLKKRQPEQGMLLGLAAGVLLLLLLLPKLLPLIETFRSLADVSEVAGEYGGLLVKGLGICILTQAAADTCRDAGEQSLAFKAELAGKIALLTLAVPLFEDVAQLALALIGGRETG